MSEMIERVALAIEQQFLSDGKWELSIIPEGHPLCIPGRWVENSDSNFAFQAVDIARAAIEAMREPTEEMVFSAGDYLVPMSHMSSRAPGYDMRKPKAAHSFWQRMIDAALKEPAKA